MSTEVVETLKAGRALVAGGQWTRGGFKMFPDMPDDYPGQCFCALGAVGFRDFVDFLNWTPGYTPVKAAAAEALKNTMPGGYRRTNAEQVFEYNDDPHTTREDVVAWFDRAIEQVNSDTAGVSA